MIINKIGSEHISNNINNQDTYMVYKSVSVVCDGCSAGKHSEVGAKLFCLRLRDWLEYNCNSYSDVMYCVHKSMREVVEFVGKRNALDYLCFTIMVLVEEEESFSVGTLGDGSILKLDNNGLLDIENIDNNNTPNYLIYDYIPEQIPDEYKRVSEEGFKFSKSEYKSIGIASDGLQYYKNSPEHALFYEDLRNKKQASIARNINRNASFFKDDITIIF